MIDRRVAVSIISIFVALIPSVSHAEQWARVKKNELGSTLYIDVESIVANPDGHNESRIKIKNDDGSLIVTKNEYDCKRGMSRVLAYKRLDINGRVVAANDSVISSTFEPVQKKTFAEQAFKLTCFNLKGPF